MTTHNRRPEEFRLGDLTPVMRERFRDGIRLFNRREFWEAHEAWEDVWKESIDPQRTLIQGLIQAAAAYHLMLTRPRLTGALRNAEKSLDKLEQMPNVCFGVNIAGLRTALRAAHAEAKKVGQKGLAEIDDSFVAQL